MHYSQINTRYAKSLFLLAKEKKITQEVKSDIEILYNTINNNKEFQTLLEHPVIIASKKKEIINKLFKGKLGEYVISFLILLIKNKRENQLKDICRNFIHIYKEKEGIKTATITTAFKLPADEKNKIKKLIENKFSTQIEMFEKTDKKIMGGMIIQVNDKQLDMSVLKQINSLRNKFENIDFNNIKKS